MFTFLNIVTIRSQTARKRSVVVRRTPMTYHLQRNDDSGDSPACEQPAHKLDIDQGVRCHSHDREYYTIVLLLHFL